MACRNGMNDLVRKSMCMGQSQTNFYANGSRLINLKENVYWPSRRARNAVWLATLGFEVEIWDVSIVGIDKAKRLATSRNVSIQTKQIDLNEADWPNKAYDMVICIFGHFPPHVREKVFTGIQQTLRPGGLFLSEVYATHQLAYGTGGPNDASLLYTEEMFHQLGDDFVPLVLHETVVWREEGTLHHGESAVIQYVGQKR